MALTQDTSIPARRLGSAGPQVGAVGLGCMGMSWAYGAAERDDDQSVAVLHRALELGVTCIDTADVYGPFTNEELVGRALAGRRDEAFLATKAGLVAVDGRVERNGRPEHIRAALDASLQRLRTDRVDLWQLHRIDPDVPVEETWGAMAEQVAAGKALRLGMSEVDTAELDRAHAVHPVATVQSELSLWTRGPLSDVLPWCEAHDAGFLPFSPLGRGFLTGALTPGSFHDGDFRARNPRFTPEAMQGNAGIVAAVGAVAQRLGRHRHRSHSRGCWRRAPRWSRSRGRRSCATSSRTPRRHAWSWARTTSRSWTPCQHRSVTATESAVDRARLTAPWPVVALVMDDHRPAPSWGAVPARG